MHKQYLTALALITTLTFAGCGSQTGEEGEETGYGYGSSTEDAKNKAVPRVATFKIADEALNLEKEFVGIVQPDKQIDIKSTINGTVSSLTFDIGDEVRSGQLLLAVDKSANNNTKVANLNNTKTSLSNVQTNLALTDGLTAENVRQAEAEVARAETGLENAKSSLENLLITVANDVKTAELNLQNAKTSNVLGVEVASTQVAAAETRLENIEDQFKLDLDNTYLNARTSIDTLYDHFINAMSQMDDILGVELKNKQFNDTFEKNLGALQPQTIYDSEFAYREARNGMNAYARLTDSEAEVDDLIDELEQTSELIVDLADKVDALLKNTLPDRFFNRATLEGMRDEHDALEQQIHGYTKEIDGIKHGIDSVKLNYENQIRSAEKDIDSAKKSLQNAEQKIDEGDTEIAVLNAQRQLDNVKAVAKTQTDSARFQVETAHKQLESARASLASAKKSRKVQLQNIRSQKDDLQGQIDIIQIDIDDQEIKAPFEGVVLSKNVEVGDEISPGQVIATIGDIENVKVFIEVSDEERKHMSKRKKVTIDDQFTGRIKRINPQVSPQSRKYQVEIELDNKKAELLPDSFVDVTVPYEVFEKSVYVPLNALFVKQSGTEIFVVEDSYAKKKVIETGKIMNDYVEIVSGLEVGEEVIVEGLKFVEEGIVVKVKR